MKHAKLMPLFQFEKEAKFKYEVLPASDFVLMDVQLGELPKGFAGKLAEPQQVAMLTYGWKGAGAVNGVIRLYETPAVKGIAQADFIKRVAACGMFRDLNRMSGYRVAGFSRDNVFYAPTGINPAGIEVAVADLKATR